MYGHTETLSDAVETIHGRFESPDYNEELKEWANNQLRPVQEDLDIVVRGDDGYEDFLLTFIGREYARFNATDASAVPYESLRERPLCTCDDLGCELKRGKLPLAVRNSDDISRGIREFKQTHEGDPLVLDYEGEPKGARQAWSAKRADVWYVVRRVKTYLRKERDEPPSADAEPDARSRTPSTAD